jgi:uncharacterized protein (TIGR00369 family)
MDSASFRYQPDPENPGWMTWELVGPERFNAVLGPVRVRREGELARCRMLPERRHTNLSENVHGGVLLTLIDVALFAGSHVLDIPAAGHGVTVEISTQFLSAGRIGAPLDAVVEKLRETGRMVFLRGTLEQGGGKVAAFSGLIRKMPQPA